MKKKTIWFLFVSPRLYFPRFFFLFSLQFQWIFHRKFFNSPHPNCLNTHSAYKPFVMGYLIPLNIVKLLSLTTVTTTTPEKSNWFHYRDRLSTCILAINLINESKFQKFIRWFKIRIANYCCKKKTSSLSLFGSSLFFARINLTPDRLFKTRNKSEKAVERRQMTRLNALDIFFLTHFETIVANIALSWYTQNGGNSLQSAKKGDVHRSCLFTCINLFR